MDNLKLQRRQEAASAMAATSRQAKTTTGQQVGPLRQETVSEVPTQGDIPVTSSTNRQVNEISQNFVDKQCCCHIQQGARGPTQHILRVNIHAEQQGPGIGDSPFFQTSKDHVGDYNPGRECKIIRLVPNDDGIFTEVVTDSVSAQTKSTIRPMFVNNYFVGDNSWRPGVQDKPTVVRVVDESTSRSSTAVQTAISFLGEDKSHNLVQVGISRVKSMNNDEGELQHQIASSGGTNEKWKHNGVVNQQLQPP